MAKRILIVDDERNIGASLRMILEREGHVVTICHSVSEFRELSRRSADLYMLDVKLPDGSGMDLLRILRQNDNPAPVVMISGHGTISDAVEATRSGAFDFLEKPLSRDKLLLVLKNAFEQADLRAENRRFRELVGDDSNGPRMIGSSPAFLNAAEQARRVARSDARVLIEGESGTGKELLAGLIHRESPFADGPFIRVNCAAIPTELIEAELFGNEKGAFTGAVTARRGRFELADGGTLFLDEVGDLHESSQGKLLRVLQEGEFQRVGGEQTIHVNVRVLAASNRDLRAMVADGRFREDLFYRLSVVPIRVPALRERREDIPEMSVYFLSEFCKRNSFRAKTFDDGVLDLLQRYSWPGNVRELKNIVERMAILCSGDRITEDVVPLEIRFPAAETLSTLQQTRDTAERDRILDALHQTDWNVSAAARSLNIERTSLHKRIKALKLSRTDR